MLIIGCIESFNSFSNKISRGSMKSNLNMKIFDWEKREKFSTWTVPEGFSIDYLQYHYFQIYKIKS